MKKAVFEVATLADAVAKANRVAPTKGAAFDRAAGIVLEVIPDILVPRVIIKSTDLEVTFRANVSVLEIGDEPVTWRLPATLFNGIMSTMPMGLGMQVTLREMNVSDGHLYFIAGKMKAKLRLIAGDFPTIGEFDADQLVLAPNFAKRLQQVAWATDDKGNGVLSGVHMDGKFLYGCNRQVVAMVPCEVPITAPVTAPLYDIAALIKNTGDVSLRAGTNVVEIMPDSWTQTTCTLIAQEYPNIAGLMKNRQTGKVYVGTEELASVLDQMLVLVKEERYPATTIEIGEGMMKVSMDVPDVGKVLNEIEVTGGTAAGEDPFTISFSPQILKNALAASGRPDISILYGPTPLDPMKIEDDNGFVALAMPIRT